jgi:hypothetical protein
LVLRYAAYAASDTSCTGTPTTEQDLPSGCAMLTPAMSTVFGASPSTPLYVGLTPMAAGAVTTGSFIKGCSSNNAQLCAARIPTATEEDCSTSLAFDTCFDNDGTPSRVVLGTQGSYVAPPTVSLPPPSPPPPPPPPPAPPPPPEIRAVTTTMSASGDVSDYTTAVTDSIKSSTATTLGIDASMVNAHGSHNAHTR